ncbi:ABC transporter substrate-binding protein [Kribbella speibonae]|uniref:ABC transporter substrate-binding protein n=1 Tax=Kribbella speibonae TaxID=1572660 RepID=A0A4R0II77_9ACTN|nr:ABC transporter substrate-binding protein [Kribbella speibonae]TCC19482.1 ABC transporter substrate-binding protein [Kribbella speibonae]TCC31860.1 ABC transporter substrate-binding protein [Kribbella speibonae]
MAAVRVVAAVLSLSLLAGCGPAAEADSSARSITVQNCGIGVTVDGPPKRVFAAYQPAIEMAHALGISDRLVGTAYLDAEVLPEYAGAQAKAKYFKNLPSREELLSLNPDFVLSGFNDVFSAAGSDSSFGSRKSLADLGVRTWIFSPLCPTADGKGDEAIDPSTVSMDNVYADLRDLGRLFGVEDRAAQVIADQQRRIAAVETAVKDAPRPTVAIVRPGLEGGQLTVSGGPDFGTVLIRQAGGVNAFADLTAKRNVKISVEEFIKRDPDYVLVSGCCDASLTPAASQPDVDKILGNPAYANLKAVRGKRVIPWLFANHSAGVRGAYTTENLGHLLHPDLVD